MELSKKIIILISLFLTIGLAGNDSTSVMEVDILNFQEFIQHSDYTLLPVQNFAFSGAVSNSGLPAFVLNYKYNGQSNRDPLFGNVPLAWQNPRYMNLKIDFNDNQINQLPAYHDNKTLYSRFDWYRGDYNFGNFGAMIAGRIDDDYLFSFYGENFNYSGWHGTYTPNPGKADQSVYQNFALDIKKIAADYEIEGGFNYKKFATGLAGFNITPVGDDNYPIPFFGGHKKRHKKQMYLQFAREDSTGNLRIGGQVANYDYGHYPTDKVNWFSGQGNTKSISGLKEKNLSNDTLSLSLKYDYNGIYLQEHNEVNTHVYELAIGNRGNRFRTDYTVRLGLKNNRPQFKMEIGKSLFKFLQTGVTVDYNHFLYPALYAIFPGNENSPISSNDLFYNNQNSVFVRLQNRYFKMTTAIDQINSEFYRPAQNTLADTTVGYDRIQMRDIFLKTQLQFQFKTGTDIYAKLYYSPTLTENEFYNFHCYGAIQQKLSLFHGNLNLYVRASAGYYHGGDGLAWMNELQTVGIVGQNYYTNEPLFFSGKAGFRVGSLHIFYQINNIEGRDYSLMPGMPLQSRLKILGVEWYFLN